MTLSPVLAAGPLRGSVSRSARALFMALSLSLLVLAAPLVARAGVFNPETFTLANGLKVVVIENHRLPVVRQMVFYRVGAADDPQGKSGLAHYLEHLMFKGTRMVPPAEFSKIVARHGGRDNAFTTADQTAFYQTVSKDNLELIMRIEADRMHNLIITPDQAVPELQVVIEERRMRTDNRPAAQLDEQVSAALYLNYPYHTPIIGWMHEVEKLTVADAQAFYKAHYAPNNAILIISGDVTVKEVRPLAEKYYGVIPANPDLEPRHRLQEPPQRAARRVTMTSKRVNEPRLSRDYLAPSHHNGATKYAYALEVLSDILGGGTTSRLYRHLVIEKKLTLGVSAYYDGDVLGPADFGFALRPRPGVSLAKAEAGLNAEIALLRGKGITADELATTKKRLLASAVFARDGLRQGASAIGTALTSGQNIDAVEKWPERISAVTVAEVNAAARHVFRIERSVTGTLLPRKPDGERDEDVMREPQQISRTPKGAH